MVKSKLISINEKDENKGEESEKPNLRLDGKVYAFRSTSIAVLVIGAPLLSIAVYLLLCSSFSYWLYESLTRQVVFFLNALFNMNSIVIMSPSQNTYPAIFIPATTLYFSTTTGCIAAAVVSISIGFITCIPSSTDVDTKKGFGWRKALVMIVSLATLHVLNLIRMIIAAYYAYIGFSFEIVHEFLLIASAIVGVIFFAFLLNKLTPEIFIAFYYIRPLLAQRKNHLIKLTLTISLFVFLVILMLIVFYFVEGFI